MDKKQMTPEERAYQLTKKLCGMVISVVGGGELDFEQASETILTEIYQARAESREQALEEAAQVADNEAADLQNEDDYYSRTEETQAQIAMGFSIGAEIRALKGGKP